MAEKKIADIKDGVVYILQPGTPVYIKTADVSALIGKSNQWTGQLTNQGTISRKQTPHGALYELKPTIRAYIKSVEDRIDEQTEDEKKIETKRKKAEASLKVSKSLIASMDAKERAGEMHRSEDVAAITTDMIYAIRGALLALPGRLAVDVLSAKDTAEASNIIREAVYAIMEELAAYKYDPAKYEERVRKRLNMDVNNTDEED